MNIPLKYEDVVAELEVLREGIIAFNPESILKQEADYLDQISTLQQRLTVAEKLLREVLESGDWFRSALEFINGEGLEVREKIEASLKPAADGEEK